MKLKHLFFIFSFSLTLAFQSKGQEDSLSVSVYFGDEIIDVADSSMSYYPINLEVFNLDTFDIKTLQVEVIDDSTKRIMSHLQFNPKEDSEVEWENNSFSRFIGFGGKANYIINIRFLNYGLIEVYSTQNFLGDDQ